MSDPDTQRLADRAAIHDLLVRNAHAQDAHDWEAHGDCFAPDVVYTHPGGEITGVETVVSRARAALTPLDASQHLLGSMLVTVDDDEAAAVTYFQAQHLRRGAEGGDLYTVAGTYRDQLRRGHDGRWYITHRVQEYSWRDGNPAVIVRGPVAQDSPQ